MSTQTLDRFATLIRGRLARCAELWVALFRGRAALILCCEILQAKAASVVRIRFLARGIQAAKVCFLPPLLRCFRSRLLQIGIEGVATFAPQLVFALEVGRFR